MSLHPSPTPRSPAGRLGILLGITGLALGVAAMLTGVAALGLGAGLLALVGPTVMLRELALVAEQPPGVPTLDEAAFDEELGVVTPFHEDSELLTAEYFGIAVKNRMTAARRFLKPLAVVQLRVSGPDTPEQIDALTGAAVVDTLRDCDTAYVMEPGRLAIVLEDTPEAGAVWAIERIRRNLAATDGDLMVWAGIACYPAHGMDTDELLAQADDALARAEEWPQNRIEVAFAE